MAVFASASGCIWENWLRDHGSWISETLDPAEGIDMPIAATGP